MGFKIRKAIGWGIQLEDFEALCKLPDRGEDHGVLERTLDDSPG